MTGDNRKRERESDELPESKHVKSEEAEESDGFSDDSFEEQFKQQSQRSQYNFSSEPFRNTKSKVLKVFPSSVVVAELDERGDETDTHHELNVDPEWVVKEDDFIYAPPEFGSEPILHSDTLISCTAVATAAQCPRRAVLSDWFREAEMGKANARMLLGNCLHELFQSAIETAMATKMPPTARTLENEMIKILDVSVRDLIACGSSIQDMLKEAKPYFDVLTNIIKKLTKTGLSVDMNYTSRENINRTVTVPSEVKIDQLQDIEENVWEPRLGLKGKVDITAKCTVKSTGKERKLIIPIELKSGKGNSVIQDHRIQTQLYGMIQSYRHDNQETSFHDTSSLLMYIRTANTHSIPIKSAEINQILAKRNVLAGHLRHPFIDKEKLLMRKLPPPIDYSAHACNTCFKRDLCAFWTKERVESTPHPIKQVQEAFELDIKHIDTKTEEHILKWTKLGLLEQAKDEKAARGNELWNSESATTIKDVTVENQQKYGTKYSVIVKLPRGAKWPFGTADTKDKERVSISTDAKVAYAFGHAKRTIVPKLMMQALKVELHLDRQLNKNEGPFRIDRAYNVGGGSFGSKLWLGNVWALQNKQQTKLRELLTGTRAPKFGLATNTIEKSQMEKFKDVIRNEATLNTDQKNVILAAVKANDFLLVQGFPGTGKTKVIAILVEALMMLGKRVLLSAYTHNAVDNVFEKVLKRLTPTMVKRCVRLGETNRMSLSVRGRAESVFFHEVKNGTEYTKRCENALLIGGTCMGVARHDFFNHVRADFVIVDEAGQTTEPITLGPLFHGDKFILVGDPKQLPPLILSRKARQNGAGVSLMERLCKEHPRMTRKLKRQYRFNKDINDLASSLSYNMEMTNEEDDNLFSALGSTVKSQSKMPDWLADAVSPVVSVTWLDTSMKRNLESKADTAGYVNHTEIALVQQLIKGLTSAEIKLKKSCIGVIAPYRAQITALQSKLDGVMVDTVDKFQGKENDVIIISMVRSAMANSEIKSDLLESLQRLNVAITRAKYKLIIVGCTATLKKLTHLAKIIKHCQEKKQIVSVPSQELAKCL